MLLEGKNAIVYGAGGDLGGAVARTFAREGATVFLVGRTRSKLEAVAAAIGDAAQVAELDAADEAAVEEHADAVERTGGIDVSLNLISRGDVQGIPLAQMELGQFEGVFDIGLRSLFLTARAAARRMAERGSGVILHLNSGSAAGAQAGMGNTGPVDAASEVFMRYLAVENGASGVRDR